ncbi:MAG: redox-regulated ATPase YchF [Thermoplasmata archaeon]
MEIGIVGKPNAGKSTFFSAVTDTVVDIANYPFTTIDPNKGIGYIRTSCPHVDVSNHCNPRTGFCMNNIRYVPVELVDVAGLVPGAHDGKGMGNKFLDDLRVANGFIHVIDSSGSTSLTGEVASPGTYDPVDEIKFLEDELAYWIVGIITKDIKKNIRNITMGNKTVEEYLFDKLAGLGITIEDILAAMRSSPIDISGEDKEALLTFAKNLLKISKPRIIAGNKADIAPEENINRLKKLYGNEFYPTSGDYELTLKKAAKLRIIEYFPGSEDFKYIKEPSSNQKNALEKIRQYLAIHKSTGVQEVIEKMIFENMDNVVVFPVQDESKYTDSQGNILPDAIIVKRGSTARDLAYKIHTDLGKNFIRAINAKTKMVIGQNYTVSMGDVIKIVSKK